MTKSSCTNLGGNDQSLHVLVVPQILIEYKVQFCRCKHAIINVNIHHASI